MSSTASVNWHMLIRSNYNDLVEKLCYLLGQQSASHTFQYSQLCQVFKNGQLLIYKPMNDQKLSSWGQIWLLIAEPGGAKCLLCHKSMCELFQNGKVLLEIPECHHHICFACMMESIDESHEYSCQIKSIVCPICQKPLFKYI